MMVISHLVALSNNLVIGVNNDLPWKLKKDLNISAYTLKTKRLLWAEKHSNQLGGPCQIEKI